MISYHETLENAQQCCFQNSHVLLYPWNICAIINFSGKKVDVLNFIFKQLYKVYVQ